MGIKKERSSWEGILSRGFRQACHRVGEEHSFIFLAMRKRQSERVVFVFAPSEETQPDFISADGCL